MTPPDPFPPRSQEWPDPDVQPGFDLAGAQGVGNHPLRRPDPGSPGARTLALLALLVVFATVVGVQQFRAGGPPPDPAARYAADQNDMYGLVARAMTKVAIFARKTSPQSQIAPLQNNVDSSAMTPADKFRAGIISAELIDPKSAAERLANLEEVLAKPTDAESDPARSEEARERIRQARTTLRDDVDLVRAWYADEHELDDAESARLIGRYGWFGQVAVTHGQLPVKRSQLFDGGGGIIALSAFLFVGLLSLAIASLVCLIVVILRISGGRFKPRFVPPTPGGSVYLETVAVFAAGFLVLTLSFLAVEKVLVSSGKEPPSWLSYVHMAAQWLLLLAIFWPRARGVERQRWQHDTGLHAGEGFFKEVGSGLLIYLASLPLFLIAGLVSFLLKFIQQAISAQISGQKPEDAGMPHNPVVDVLVHGDAVTLILLFFLATMWAPLVEETIFRGCFFRHLRSRAHWLVAGLVSAMVFGGMHGYEFVMLLPVITLGFVFSAMREWRGSLVAPITCHLLHNGTVLLIAITFISLVKQ